MTLVAAENISKRFNDQVILDRASFTILAHDRIGLVGKNGSGKTTLFEILAGGKEVDSGTINRARQCSIDYAEQEKTEYHGLTLFEYVASARQDLLDLRRQIRQLEEMLSHNPHDAATLNRLGQLQQKYELENGFTFENDIKTILTGIGFDEYRFNDYMAAYSGGEKNRAGLAHVLAGKGTLLLLDEPTNHLDIESTRWLEDFLSKTTKAFIVVSHDRTFLSNAVQTVWEINHGKIDFYSCDFAKYLVERAERRRLHQHHYRHQQEEIKRIEEYVRRNMAGQKTKQAQSKLKYLERIKRIPPPKSDGSEHRFEVKSSGRSYAHVLSVEGVTVGYGNAEVVEDVSFDVYRGDRIGIIGANGSGKSTLLKTLIGELSPIGGEIRLGNNVDVAYFDQELSELDPDRTVLENLWELDPSAEIGVIRSFLGRFGFTGEESLKKVAAISGGEKTKLSLARLLYHPANFIIFDEPTNHLDMVSREALEEALRNYDGSFLIVSHDRYFLDQVVEKILYIDNGKLTIYAGNYSYFREKTEQVQAPEQKTERPSRSKEAYLEFKEKSKQRSRLKKKIETTKEQITSLESELETITVAIQYEIPASDWETLQQSTNRKDEIEEALLELYHRLEGLEGLSID